MRCGACNEVFDGNAALLEPPVPPAAPIPAPPPAPAPVPAPLSAAVPFDAAMAALDTHAAAALQPATEDASVTLELDTAESADTAELANTAELADAADAADTSGTADGADAFITITSDAAYVQPATAYAQAGAPFAVPTSPSYASGIDATPTLAPMPTTAEDKLELDLDLDLDLGPATGMQDWDTAASAPADAIHLAEAAAANASTIPDVAPTPAVAAEHDLVAPVAEPERDAPFTLDDSFQLEPDDMADAGPALEIEADRLAPLNALADGRREPTWGEPATPPPAAIASATAPAALSDTNADDEDEVLVDLSPAARAQVEAPLPITASRGDDEPAFAAHAVADGLAADLASADTNTDTTPDEPGFVKRHHRRQRLGKLSTIVMSLGSVLLVGALVGQGATTFRNQLAANVPQLKPALRSLCTALGCQVELPAQIDYVTIEQGELQTLSESTFSFTTLLRNQGPTAQAWPDIELRLDDASDKAVLRRVFAPRDYLGPDADLGKGFAPHSEQSVKLYFELKQLKASGYHIAVFYP
ncbi:DUF3426 domain-containing protein [Rugamonas apoptosis]|uniref:DUF3426 domain-containing protein n=1 Tax=Rugamonas apoptosis TaxID=2758570 RepID=UPI0040574432